jgi:hypothetical protein
VGKFLGRKVKIDTSSPAHKLPRELNREMQKFKNLASRLAQESQKVDAWNGEITRLFSMHLDRVQKARKREYEAYKRREGALTREKNKLLAQNRELKLALDGKRSEVHQAGPGEHVESRTNKKIKKNKKKIKKKMKAITGNRRIRLENK